MTNEANCRDCFLSFVTLFSLTAWSFCLGWYLGEQVWPALLPKLGLAFGMSLVTFFGAGAIMMSKQCCDAEQEPRHENW